MSYFSTLNARLIKQQTHKWRIRYFKLVGLHNPFSTNEGTDDGFSNLIGSILSVKDKKSILAKGGILGPLIERLFCVSGCEFHILLQKRKQLISSIVMRLCILHKQPPASFERLIGYHTSDFVWGFAVDHNTGHVAISTDNLVDMWETPSGMRKFSTKTEHSSIFNRVAFGGGDKKGDSILAACSINEISIYAGSTLNGISCTQKMTSIETVTTVKFSPDCCVLVTCLSNKTVDVWKEKQSGDGNNVWVCVETLPEQTGEITSVAFYQSKENLILAIGLGDNTIKIWELSSDETKPSSCIDTLAGHSSWVTSIAFHPYLKSLASGSNDKTVKVWVPNNGRFICRLTLNEHKSPVCSVAFSPSGFLASGSTNDRCKIWRLIISATCVNAELILTKFVEKGINQLEFCQKTGTLRICHYDGVSTLE